MATESSASALVASITPKKMLNGVRLGNARKALLRAFLGIVANRLDDIGPGRMRAECLERQ